MIEKKLEFELPKPWQNVQFKTDKIRNITFLVGPNGSGKSRFAQVLKPHLGNARLLGTDRIQFAHSPGLLSIWGDNLADGFSKQQFGNFKGTAANLGSGIDTFVILEERLDIKLRVEATLSSLFARSISLDWESGYLVPHASSLKTGDSYRFDKDECHGIREMLVLLTHLYNDQHEFLIIDEPELNLHPQFQAFFMQEVRKVAGTHLGGTSQKKGIVLITHSPFIIDLQTFDDLASIISFSTDHTVPKVFSEVTEEVRKKFSSMISRLNVHHKQLFFSDNPIFVEGILDAQFLEAFQQRRNMSVTAAGSCIIDVGGNEEVTKYFDLCEKLGKKAFFVFDLDSLFIGSLRKSIREDGTISEFLARLGMGQDFARFYGDLDRTLTRVIKKISEDESEALGELKDRIKKLDNESNPKNFARARVAALIELAHARNEVMSVVGENDVRDVEGRLRVVVDALATKNIVLLTGGSLENYLPSYKGPKFDIADSLKVEAVTKEIEIISSGLMDGKLEERYGELYNFVAKLPASKAVDINSFIEKYASDFIHAVQGLMVITPELTEDQINKHFSSSSIGLGKLFKIAELKHQAKGQFSAKVIISGFGRLEILISDKTNAGMRDFQIVTIPE